MGAWGPAALPGPRQLLGVPGLSRSPFGLCVFLPGTVLCQIVTVFSPSEPLVGCGRPGSRQVSEIPNFWRDPEAFCALPERAASPPLLQVAGVTALACGMISVGSCNGDVTSTILQTIMEKSETELKDTYARWLPLGLGLNHLGKGGAALAAPGAGVWELEHPSATGLSPHTAPQGKERRSRPSWRRWRWCPSPSAASPTPWWTSAPTRVSWAPRGTRFEPSTR